MPTEAIKSDYREAPHPNLVGWLGGTHAGDSLNSMDFGRTLSRGVETEIPAEVGLSAPKHVPNIQVHPPVAGADSLDAVVTRLEAEHVYVLAKRQGKSVTLRMSAELFSTEAKNVGSPVRITLSQNEAFRRIKVERRDVEPVVSEEADNLLAWVNAL